MRLFVLGATGRTGAQLIDLALEHGHDVTALVRGSGRLAPHPRLHEVSGDPRTGEGLAAAMAGHDAVLSTLGARPRDALRPSTLMTELGEATVAAMWEAGVSRLALLSAAVLFPDEGIFYSIVRWILRHHATDLRRMEDGVRASALEWTIVRPPRLVHASDTVRRTEVGALPPRGRSISFRAVAACMLESIEQRSHVGEIVGVAR